MTDPTCKPSLQVPELLDQLDADYMAEMRYLRSELANLRGDKERPEWALRFTTSEQWATVRALANGYTEKARKLIDKEMGRNG